jgi:hypothetical protein
MRQVLAFLRRLLLTTLGALIFLAVVVALWIFSTDVIAFLEEHLLAVGIVGGCLLVFALI